MSQLLFCYIYRYSVGNLEGGAADCFLDVLQDDCQVMFGTSLLYFAPSK